MSMMNKRVIRTTIAFISVIVAVGLVFLLCYKPNFSSELSGDNADWGDFGQFFFGMGTLLVAIVTAYIMLGVDTQLHRSNTINIYEERLRRLRNILNDDIKHISRKELKSAYLDMQIGLEMIKDNDNFSCEVRKRAEVLFNGVSMFDMKPLTNYLDTAKEQDEVDEYYSIAVYEQLTKLVGELAGFVVCLVNNKI